MISPIDPIEAEDAFFIEIEIVGQEVAPRIPGDLKQFFCADRAPIARMTAADVAEGEWSLVTAGTQDGHLFRTHCLLRSRMSVQAAWALLDQRMEKVRHSQSPKGSVPLYAINGQ